MAKGLIGPAILQGIGQGVEKGAENFLKLKHMNLLEQLAMMRGLHGAVTDWWKNGGYFHPVPEDQPDEIPAGATATQLGGPMPATK